MSTGGTQRYLCDANGNAITRTVGASTYALTYDGENQLTTRHWHDLQGDAGSPRCHSQHGIEMALRCTATMNTPEIMEAIQAILQHTAEDVRNQVSERLLWLGRSGTPNAGAWSNANGIAVGHVSFSPAGRLATISLDAVVSVKVEGQHAELVTDLAWADGTIIAEIGKERIEYTDSSHLLTQLTSYGSEVAAKRYSAFLAAVTRAQ
jgi:YD repeat-containing protein